MGPLCSDPCRGEVSKGTSDLGLHRLECEALCRVIPEEGRRTGQPVASHDGEAEIGNMKGLCVVSLFPPADGQEVLQAMRNYVRFFFGCRDCADHFEQMAAASMHRVTSPKNAVLWLWTSHNRVNARLSGKEGPLPGLEMAFWGYSHYLLLISASPVKQSSTVSPMSGGSILGHYDPVFSAGAPTRLNQDPLWLLRLSPA